MALQIIEEQIEEKVSCNATLQDNFEDDVVNIILKQNVSFEFKNYTTEDFSEVDCEAEYELLTLEILEQVR